MSQGTITLITGLPGSGKSLYLVKLLHDDFKDRERYAHGIDQLDFEALGVSDFDPKEWRTLPPGCVWIVDEARHDFPTRSAHTPPPDYISDLAEARHYGHEIILAVQDPGQIDPFIRKLVHRHLHFRRNLGFDFVNIREFRGVNFKADHKDERKNTVSIKRWKLDKKLFGFYKSAEVHTVKKRVPLKLVGAVAMLIICAAAFVNLFAWMLSDDVPGKTKKPEAETATFSPFEPSDVAPIPLDELETIEGYYASHAARIEGLPWTAPFYDDVFKAEVYPIPHCILAEAVSKCVCHSQQGTTMPLQYSDCEYFAKNGFFDPTKENLEPDKSGPVYARLPMERRLPQAGRETRTESNRPPFTNWNFQPRKVRAGD